MSGGAPGNPGAPEDAQQGHPAGTAGWESEGGRSTPPRITPETSFPGGPLAFDATHWLGDGAADDPGVAVAELALLNLDGLGQDCAGFGSLT
jgi:hypothetical protein